MAAKRAGGSTRVAGMVAAFVAAAIARKVITFGWKRITGKEPPTDPQDPDVAVLEPGNSTEALWLPGIGLVSLLFSIAAFIWIVPAIAKNP